MNLTESDILYIQEVTAAIDSGEVWTIKYASTECQDNNHFGLDDQHVHYAGSVLIACEGYWQYNPRMLNSFADHDSWNDWTEPEEVQDAHMDALIREQGITRETIIEAMKDQTPNWDTHLDG